MNKYTYNYKCISGVMSFQNQRILCTLPHGYNIFQVPVEASY